MKLSTEKIILGILGTMLAWVYLPSVNITDAFLYRIVELGSMAVLFTYLGIQWIGKPERAVNGSGQWKVLIALLTGAWFVNTLGYALLAQYRTGEPMQWWYLFHPSYLDNLLESLLPAIIAGLLYGSVRRMILLKKWRILKRVGYVCLCVSLLAISIFGVFYYVDVSYSGDTAIQFIDKEQSLLSLEEVLSQPELQGKKVYVDLWYSSCSPCIKAFRNNTEGKKLLGEKGVVTLYLGRETSHPNSKQLWVNTIRDYKLTGYHVYMSEELEQDVYTQVGKYVDRYFGYPHYLLINEEGEVSSWDAPDIMDLDELKKKIG